MQHGELVQQVFDLFGVTPDYNLAIMRPGQDLFYMTQSILQKTKELFIREKPSLVIVQGDTTSAMVAALSAFYLKIPIAHVEAGLRTDDLYAPYPEEMNRRVIGTLAQHHFAPTDDAVQNLYKNGIAEKNISCVGNTVVDALRIMTQRINDKKVALNMAIAKIIDEAKAANKKLVLLTLHRREAFSGGIEAVLETVKKSLHTHKNIMCLYPFHPNPHVLQALQKVGLDTEPGCFLVEPLSYADMVFVLQHVDLVMTDSGGIQEEAVSLGKSVLVLREKTERMEGVYAGLAKLIGFDSNLLAKEIEAVAYGRTKLTPEASFKSVYGDGFAAEKIVANLQRQATGVEYKIRFCEDSSAVGDADKKAQGEKEKKDIFVKKVSVIGLGYIGLPTSLVLAEHNFEVVGVDVNSARVEKINAGDPDIYEPEVYEKLQLALQSGAFRAQTAMHASDYMVIAVPTPCVADVESDHQKSDLSYVFSAADAIVPVLHKGMTIILESTVPVGATKKLADYLEEKSGLTVGRDFYVAHCPERVLPGKIFHELIENDRVIGGVTPACARKAHELYDQFVRGELYMTQAAAAEMVKLVENSSRDVQIAFANQVGAMAYAAGVDPYEVIELANKHPRVNVLKPSCGVGGHCIAVDPWFLIETFPEQTKLLQMARSVNDEKPLQVVQALQSAVKSWQKKNEGKRCTVAACGLSYKADIDDLRESPALAIAQTLATDKTIDLVVCEPNVKKDILTPLFGARLVSVDEAVTQADLVLFLVPHTRFKVIDKKRLTDKVVLDVCGLFYTDKTTMTKKEALFWPARSMMDFFIVNQEEKKQAFTTDDVMWEDRS